MGQAIKYLYSQFILRDVLSFITPGAIVVLTAFLLFLPEPCLWQRLDKLFDYSRSVHWLLYVPFFGVFYMVGFAVQCFGELAGLVRIHRIAGSTLTQRLQIFLKRNWGNDQNIWVSDQNIWWIAAHRQRVQFYEYTNENARRDEREWARQQDERLVVLKQMCANGALAVVIAASLITVHEFCSQGWYWLLLLSWMVMLLASLFWGYCAHELRLNTMDRAIQHQLWNSKKGS